MGGDPGPTPVIINDNKTYPAMGHHTETHQHTSSFQRNYNILLSRHLATKYMIFSHYKLYDIGPYCMPQKLHEKRYG